MTETPEIIVYGTRWCYDTTRARRWLDQHNITYRYIDIEHDNEARLRVETINNGYRSVPTIIFPDGSILVEPSNPQLAAKFGL